MLLRLAREHDVLLESFRPGVLDRLGVGYERLKQENPGLVYCAITGYGQDGPKRDAAGHDMNYLALGGPARPHRRGATAPPIQAAGQIADVGGGALMAAVGILAALRERDALRRWRPGRRRLDVRRRAVVAGDARRADARGRAGRRSAARSRSRGSSPATAPTRASDGWVACGALEPKFWQAWCRGVGREDLIEQQFAAPGSDGHRAVAEVFASRTRAEWEAFAAEHDCCLEPVLDLDEALDSELVRAREMVVELDQPGAVSPVRLLGLPIKLDRTPGDPAPRARARRSASTPTRCSRPPATRPTRSRR